MKITFEISPAEAKELLEMSLVASDQHAAKAIKEASDSPLFRGLCEALKDRAKARGEQQEAKEEPEAQGPEQFFIRVVKGREQECLDRIVAACGEGFEARFSLEDEIEKFDQLEHVYFVSIDNGILVISFHPYEGETELFLEDIPEEVTEAAAEAIASL